MTLHDFHSAEHTDTTDQREADPWWTGLRVAEDHTKHAANGATDRERGE